MFAIEITEENLPQILQTPGLTIADAQLMADAFIAHNNDHVRYFIKGYTDRKNRLVPWTTLPEFIFVKNFDFDPEKIKTDWDIVVRKAA